ncbi:hypothetical protein ZWY2020_030032 [Hordeum vulgare]|nr:hypothetical protein ZWY2020_030032 [Hordeum vulgare]
MMTDVQPGSRRIQWTPSFSHDAAHTATTAAIAEEEVSAAGGGDLISPPAISPVEGAVDPSVAMSPIYGEKLPLTTLPHCRRWMVPL